MGTGVLSPQLKRPGLEASNPPHGVERVSFTLLVTQYPALSVQNSRQDETRFEPSTPVGILCMALRNNRTSRPLGSE